MAWINKPKRRTPEHITENEKRRREIYSTTRWRKLRAAKERDNPLCEICLANDRVTPTEDIHHITTFVDIDDALRRKDVAYNYDNLQSLCKVCHQKIHNGTANQ